MSVRHELAVSANRLIETSFPSGNTLPKFDRLATADNAIGSMVHLFDGLRSNRFEQIPNEVFTAIGVYATKQAYKSIILGSQMTHHERERISDELHESCSVIQGRNPKDLGANRRKLGHINELAFLNFVWNGMATGKLNFNYALMVGEHGRSKGCAGLKDDYDMLIRIPGKKKKSKLQKVQIKTAAQSANQIYADDIVVLSSQDILDTNTAPEATCNMLAYRGKNSVKYDSAYKKLLSKMRAAA